jgi:hypothetical protein
LERIFKEPAIRPAIVATLTTNGAAVDVTYVPPIRRVGQQALKVGQAALQEPEVFLPVNSAFVIAQMRLRGGPGGTDALRFVGL